MKGTGLTFFGQGVPKPDGIDFVPKLIQHLLLAAVLVLAAAWKPPIPLKVNTWFQKYRNTSDGKTI